MLQPLREAQQDPQDLRESERGGRKEMVGCTVRVFSYHLQPCFLVRMLLGTSNWEGWPYFRGDLWPHVVGEWPPSWASGLSMTNLSFCLYRHGRCRHAATGCHVGLRRKTYFVLAGSVLGVWSHIEGVFNRCPGHNQRMQIIRVKTNSKRLVGMKGLHIRLP